MGEALNQFVAEAQGLAAHFDFHTVFSIGGWEVTQYVVWLFIALAVTFAVVLISAKKLQLIPTNKFFNTVEYGYEFVNKSDCRRRYRQRLQAACALPGHDVLLHSDLQHPRPDPWL